jgi:hypothetical protein
MGAVEMAIGGRREEAERLLAEAPPPEPGGCWRAPLSIARTHLEVLLGGNDTSHLLQVLCCSKADDTGSGESMDILASILSAEDEDGKSVLDARGRDAAKLVDLFWECFPTAALLLRSKAGGFEYARAEGVDGPVDRAVAQGLAQTGGRIRLPPPSR